MSNAPLAMVRNRVASVTQLAYQKVPVPAALAGLSFVALERLGERATSTRKRRVSLLSLGGMLVLVSPAAAQVNCGGNGPLAFLGSLYNLVTMSAGTIVISMVILAGVLKMVPMRGTNSWGNALVGSVLTGVAFLVLGPALVNLADQATGINLNAQCTGGGGG
jgi:hypothetical protein